MGFAQCMIKMGNDVQCKKMCTISYIQSFKFIFIKDSLKTFLMIETEWKITCSLSEIAHIVKSISLHGLESH